MGRLDHDTALPKACRLLAAVATLALLAATGATAEAADAKTATSAADFGGMDGLVAAAKQEGELNVIALPPDWANYGTMIETFQSKYGIKVNSAQPDASSQDEINAANQLRGQARAPDVFDLGANVALRNTHLFAPYKVATWNDIPEPLKDPNGTWVNDYGGYMSVGYDADRVPAITSVADLMKPEFKGKVALNGNPTQASAGFHGVMMAAIANGGSADNIEPGLEFFRKLKETGNFLPVDPTPATIASGETPVVIDWEYLNVAQSKQLEGQIDWKLVVPEGAAVGAYYVQAINKDAPHPAAARLWQEFLYSDEGQNIWLRGFARPVRLDAMVKAGTVDKDAVAALPEAKGTPVYLTQEQINTQQKLLIERWDEAVQ
ncbi:ABC transporter substrate-binding protein [Geminicoccus flavidas]|uniref:ABC transporter substrate-binding protein n=1 Tax=Geminicoccus flavidas TaxID=2506407 RepID=UPI001358FFDB|nr:ABC transporter substrate-binding protein [Geminicoccus flavidas]